jgi:pimeloyl-ACP methyl ester carboxylesterase
VGVHGAVRPIAKVRVPEIIARLESVIAELDSPPILIGHSAGGTFVQILLDHGHGAAGVAINSAPTEDVPAVPFSQLESTFPVLKMTNTFSEDESGALYERYQIPASGAILFGSVLANVQPGHQDTWVNCENDDRAPLLFISGSEDDLMPPKVQRSNAKHYKSHTITEVKEFDRPHLLPAKAGWQEVADYALSWAVSHAAQPSAA